MAARVAEQFYDIESARASTRVSALMGGRAQLGVG